MLKGHQRKVMGLQWHRTADNVLATHGADSTVRVWDVENQKCTMVYDQLSNFCTAMRWSPSGDKLTVVVKGGDVHSYDPRSEGPALTTKCHIGPRSCKIAYIDDNSFITVGSNKQAEREYAVWDARNISEKVAGGHLGQGLGVGHIYFDEEHKILYSAGRGESQIGIWQYDEKVAGHLTFLSNFSDKWPTKGCSIMPKTCLDAAGHEVDRFVRLDNKGTIEYLSFRLNNRTGLFQPDLHLPFQSNTPSSDYAEWATGVDKKANLMVLKEDMDDAELHPARKSAFLAKIKPKAAGAAPAKVATANAGASNEEAEAKIAALQIEVAKVAVLEA